MQETEEDLARDDNDKTRVTITRRRAARSAQFARWQTTKIEAPRPIVALADGHDISTAIDRTNLSGRRITLALRRPNTIDLYMSSQRDMNTWGARQEPIQILHWAMRQQSLQFLNRTPTTSTSNDGA